MTLDGRYRINVKTGTVVKVQERSKEDSALIIGIVKELIIDDKDEYFEIKNIIDQLIIKINPKI